MFRIKHFYTSDKIGKTTQKRPKNDPKTNSWKVHHYLCLALSSCPYHVHALASSHILVLCCAFQWWSVLSSSVVSCPVLSCPVLSCAILYYLVLAVLSCPGHILSYLDHVLALSCPCWSGHAGMSQDWVVSGSPKLVTFVRIERTKHKLSWT